MRRILNIFQNLSSQEKKQVKILAVVGSLAVYLFVAANLWDSMFYAERMADRKQSRTDTRIGDYEPPELDPAVNQRAYDKVADKVKDVEQQLISYNSQMLPLNDPDPREKTKLELTRLATQNNIQITGLETINAGIRPLPEEMTGRDLRYIFVKRPIFKVSSYGSYFDFIRYIDSLSKLPYRGVIRELDVHPNERGNLDISFELQM